MALLCVVGFGSAAPGGVAQRASSWKAELIHRSPTGEVARSVVERRGELWTGSVTRDGHVVVRGRFERNAQGQLLAYRRELLDEAGRVRSRVTLSPARGGFRLREESPIGTRSKRIAGGAVRGVLDAAWPSVVAPWLDELDAGVIPILDLGTESRLANVAVRTREGGARFVDLDGGGLTYWPDPRGGPLRIDLPGAEGLSIRRLGAEANPKLAARENPPAGVLDTALELSVGPKLRLKARWTRPAAAPGPLPGVLLLPDAGPRDADGRDAAGRNPILRDLAWTLAGQGFATLRFEKRGDHPRWKQLIADGRVALKSLRSSDGHSGQIALLGVGEGALLAAEIARADGKVAGLAYLGAPHRALSETLELRLRHDLLEAQLTRTELQAELDELRSGLSVLRKGPAESLAPDERLVHDLLKISPVSTTVDLAIPRLWIFAERDPETRQSDINRLRTVLALQGEAPWKLERLNDADARFRRLGPTDSPERDGADPTRPLHPSLPLFLAEHFRKALKG